MASITTATTGYLHRLIGAAALDSDVYEEVEADESATSQAFLTVVLSSAAAGIGARGFGGAPLVSFAFVSVVSLLAWAVWALVTFEVGTNLLPTEKTHADVGELLRTIGFASTPGFLMLLGVLQGGTTMAFVVSALWMLAAMVVAVRQALDYESTGRAIAVCLLGWTMAVGVAVTVGVIFGPVVY
jgi:hypothetical protein